MRGEEGGRADERFGLGLRFSFDNFRREASRGTLRPKERSLPRRLLSPSELIFRPLREE